MLRKPTKKTVQRSWFRLDSSESETDVIIPPKKVQIRQRIVNVGDSGTLSSRTTYLSATASPKKNPTLEKGPTQWVEPETSDWFHLDDAYLTSLAEVGKKPTRKRTAGVSFPSRASKMDTHLLLGLPFARIYS